MTQEQHKYYSNGYDDGKQSVGDQYVQILLKKDQEINKLTEQNHKLMAENDTTSEVYGETKDLLEACKSANELMEGEIETLKAENSKMRNALEEISETPFNISDRATAMTMRSIATEALK